MVNIQFLAQFPIDHLVHPVIPMLLLFITYKSFSHQRKLMVFHWSLSDSKSPQVSRTLLSILAVFNNAVVGMVSTRSPTSKSSSIIIIIVVVVVIIPDN